MKFATFTIRDFEAKQFQQENPNRLARSCIGKAVQWFRDALPKPPIQLELALPVGLQTKRWVLLSGIVLAALIQQSLELYGERRYFLLQSVCAVWFSDLAMGFDFSVGFRSTGWGGVVSSGLVFLRLHFASSVTQLVYLFYNHPRQHLQPVDII